MYVAVNCTVPVPRDPAGILIVAVPALNAADALKLPPVRVIVPVGTGAPGSTVTATVAVSPWVAVMLGEDRVSATIGVAFKIETMLELSLVALKIGELVVSGV